MTTPILVTGGTGTLGRLVTPRLVAAGHPVRVLSRHAHEPAEGVRYVTGDLRAEDGTKDFAAALDGTETVLHLAGDAKHDVETTRNLVRAAAAYGGVRHLVFISVVAADRVPVGYFRAKLAAERVVEESGLPWTTLRAAQFHDFVLNAVRVMAKLPVIPVPGGVRFQSVETAEVADRIVELAGGGPAGLVPDLAGPEVLTLREAVTGYLRATGRRRPLLPVPLPGKAGRVYRAGGNLNVDTADTGRRTWGEFLAEQTRG